jgi:pyridoxamine 5'-phosphate oxidase
MSKKIDFYNSLELTLLEAENLISDGVENSKSMFHTPVLSSFVEKTISTRTVVLREFDSKNRTLRFHTDIRSGKIEELKENSISSVHGYDPDLKVQIRLKGKTSLHIDNEISKKAWAESREMSKMCYSVKDSPGNKISSPEPFDLIKEEIDIELGYNNFAVLHFSYDSLEFLFLKGAGHRRSLFDWNSDQLESSWLIP